jgi:hypothetical protein
MKKHSEKTGFWLVYFLSSSVVVEQRKESLSV